MRILITEVQPDIGSIMTKLVVNAGHQAFLAVDGYAAIRLAAALAPQLVLLDINMRGIDGYETARRLRERFGDRFLIFAVTTTPMDMRLVQQSRFDGIFAKPCDVNKLTALIAHLSLATPAIRSARSAVCSQR